MPAGTLTRERLDRWELFGALWHIVHLSETVAVVQFCTCFDEPVERLRSTDAAVIAYLRSRSEAD